MKKLLAIVFFAATFLFAGIGDDAPDFTLNKLGGGTVTLDDFQGKVLYIFWFGHGCPFCDDNIRQAQINVTSKYSSEVFAAIGIDTWSGSNTTNVANFQASTSNASLPSGVTFPLCIDGGEVASDFGATYDRSMVIDQQGIIRYYGGSHNPHDWSGINNVIQGLLTTTDIQDETLSAYTFELKPNYPNPFNPQTQIPFTINKSQKVKLQVYNISGQLVKTIINTPLSVGSYIASWNALDDNSNAVSSGVYFIRLSGEKINSTRQIILIK